MNLPVIGQQLLAQAPVLLVYIVGMAFCLLYYGRCPTPAILALVGLALGVVAIIGYTLVFAYLLEIREDLAWSHERFGTVFQSLGVAAGFTRAVGLALIVLAVFVGRGRSQEVPRHLEQRA
jgi:xanthosine utilization system XapX-like protein